MAKITRGSGGFEFDRYAYDFRLCTEASEVCEMLATPW